MALIHLRYRPDRFAVRIPGPASERPGPCHQARRVGIRTQGQRRAVWMQTTGASQYVVERRRLVRVLVAAHDCRRPQVLLYLAAVRDGPSPNGVVCAVWLTAIAITTGTT